jgi:hypothetical protein
MPLRLLFSGLCALAMGAAPAMAEDAVEDVAGIYEGHQTELGAGLKLDGDGRFNYFMSYGAVDEMAVGTWTVTPDGVLLDSDPMLAPAFVLVDSKGGGRSSFDLTLDAPGQIPIQFFAAVVFFADGTRKREEFQDSKLHLKLERGQSVEAIALLFDVYQVSSDKVAVPPKIGSMHFRFDPNDLGTVKFDHELLRKDGGAFLLERYDRTLRFRKEAPEEVAAYPVDAPDPGETLQRVTGVWTYTGQDCDTDNYFEPPAEMPGASFELSPDYSYRLTRLGQHENGTFTLVPSEYFPGEFLVKLDQAGLTYILNIDRLESWSEGAVVEQCTQLFERPGQAGE